MKNKYLAKMLLMSLIFLTFEIKAQVNSSQPKFICRTTIEDKKYLEILLRAAVTADDEQCVKEILSRGVSPNGDLKEIDGTAPIVIAANGKKVEITKLLIAAGVDMESSDTKEAVLVAASQRNFDLMDIFLKSKADPNGQGIDGSTPLMVSAFKEDIKIVKLLLDFNANVNAQTKMGVTALMVAGDDDNIVETLIKSGSELEAADVNGWTAIFYAVQNEQIKKLEVLLQSGAKTDLKDKNNTSLLMLLQQNKKSPKKEKIINLLKKSVAK